MEELKRDLFMFMDFQFITLLKSKEYVIVQEQFNMFMGQVSLANDVNLIDMDEFKFLLDCACVVLGKKWMGVW